ncbi:g11796 [Coccomyxa viridis]|uniref:G11796 protein n=1 Tax=Coccomyxa viridis TaxID=1274662 RepID=A0ABP1GBH0_9CHLO
MAARHLQKLRSTQAAEQEVEDSDASEDAAPSCKVTPFNPFDLLSDEEAQAPAEDSDEEDEAALASSAATRPAPAQQSKPGKQRKKKKKKGRGDPADEAEHGAAATADEEDLDKLLSDLNIHLDQRQPEQQQQQQQQQQAPLEPPLFTVNKNALKGEEEMRRMFGRDVVRMRHQEDEAADLGRIGNRQVRRAVARRGLQRRTPLKMGKLITPRVTWPSFDAGLSMETFGTTPEGVQLFRYVHSTAYRGIQALFEQCQASMDPNSIAQLLAHHPYHIDALLAMFELYRATGQHEQADELLQRCLYALEMALHPFFQWGEPNCRIPFEEESNRPLFAALFKHMQGLSRKGLHATAFEVAKVLMLLDPDDPMGAIFCIDYFALRSQNYRWLQRFGSGDAGAGVQFGTVAEGAFTATTLPNLAMSVPLAELRLHHQRRERADAAGSRAKATGGSSSGAAAAPEQDTGDEERLSLDALAQAVLLHPFAVQQLMARLQDKGVGTDQEWHNLLQKPLFTTAASETSASLAHISEIFVERHYLVWKAADAQQWLKAACRQATEGPMASTAADFACAREQAFPPAEENAFRHLRTSDFSDSVAALPPEELQAAVMGGARGGQGGEVEQHVALQDGRWEEVLNQLPQEVAAQLQNTGHVRLEQEQLQEMGPLRALLQSLLPWVNAGQVPDYEAEGEEAPQLAGGNEQNGGAEQRHQQDHEPDNG